LETQQLGHAPRSESEIKNVKSSTKDGAPEWLRCGTIQKEVNWIVQLMFEGAARRILPFYAA